MGPAIPLALADGLIETVFIPETQRSTVCISPRWAVRWVAAPGQGRAGICPYLAVEKVIRCAGAAAAQQRGYGNGRALDNYDELIRIGILNAPWGLTSKQITVPLRVSFGAGPELKADLAVSSRADDDKRSRIMPIARIPTADGSPP